MAESSPYDSEEVVPVDLLLKLEEVEQSARVQILPSLSHSLCVLTLWADRIVSLSLNLQRIESLVGGSDVDIEEC